MKKEKMVFNLFSLFMCGSPPCLEGGRGGDRTLKSLLKFLFHIFCFFIFFSCENEKAKIITPAFYHWQTHLNLAPAERQLMDSLNVKKIYAKFFDIDLNNNKPLPQAIIQINKEYLNGINIIPTVFITNRVFKNISEKEIKGLAENILKKINVLNSGIPMEIQFDCDWTETTKSNFFYFLRYFKKQLKNRISLTTPEPLMDWQAGPIVSATIRLHQLKFPDKTGVPPVDKGMLMFYNVGDLGNWETENSILDLSIAEKYLIPNTQYPIPLDIALPIFKWGVIFRNGELVYLINDLNENELMDESRFKKINKNRYAVTKSTYLDGYYLYENDLIRLEKTTLELLESAAEMLSGRFAKSLRFSKPQNPTVSFYHLDTATLKTFHYKDFKKILWRFSE